MRSLVSVLFAISALSAAETVKSKINLFDIIKSGEVEYHVNQAMEMHDDPKAVWSFTGDDLHISGRGYGYVATKKDYRDYHLVLEFKWGTKTHGARETKARDNGILLHAYGPHGAYSGTWMASIEAQIIEGGVGDILVLSPKLPDGKELTTSVMSEFSLDRDKEKIWTPGAPKQLVTKGRINWQHRDVDWTDTRGFRGREDKESPPGEWNRLECIADGDHLTYFLNGAKVNEAFECKPSEGRVLLQTEGAEMIVRRYELWPLGQFAEKWNPIQASGGSDVDVRAGQERPMTAEESQKQIQLDGPYEVQLVADEPLIVDPVECTWDAKGRMFVADMLDYPLGPKDPNDPPMSRIVQLIDSDGDGRMDKSRVFADHVDFVQGLLPYKDGLIATTRTEVLFLKDSDGDGKADVRESLIKGFNPRHAQLQVSAPRWGLDGCVHFNNGLDAKEIYSIPDSGILNPDPTKAASLEKNESGIKNQKSGIDVSRSNFKWDPRTGKITPTGGVGQYGGAFDDWGHHFYCSNRNPVMFTVMPYEAMIRNPHAGVTQNYEDIAPSGAESRVYPLKITHTTADAHAGTNTAACGLGVYRGDLMPELKNNVFVCDPTGQLVTRYKVEPNGASLKATRVGKNTEFFRSGDEWCRPVNVTTGPDGALYIVDMYRRYIDHARFFPEEFVKTHDMREGENQGRIWRVVPKGTRIAKESIPGLQPAIANNGATTNSSATTKTTGQPSADGLKSGNTLRRIEPAPEKIEDLVAWLGHENAWQRETAQRLLVETQAPRKEAFWHATEKQKWDTLFAFTVFSFGLGLEEESNPLKPKSAEHGRVTNLMSSVLANHQSALTKDPTFDMLVLKYLIRNDGPTSADIASQKENPEAVLFQVLNAGSYPRPAYSHIVKAALTNFPDDPWIHKAVLSAYPQMEGAMYGATLKWFVEGEAGGKYSPEKAAFIKQLGACLGNPVGTEQWNVDDFKQGIETLFAKDKNMTWWKPALLQGLAEGLPRSGGKLGVKSLAELIAKPPAQFAEAAKEISALMAQIETTAKDPKALLDTRLSVLHLLAQNKWDKVQPIVKNLLTTTQPAELTTAALALLKKFSIKSTEPFIYELLPHASPAIKGQLVAVLAAGSPLELLKRMERGEIPLALVDVEKRWGLQRGKGELAELAKKLFGQPSADRAAVIASYMDCTKKLGDATKGKAVFQTICIACHKIGDIGQEVGPPLADVKAKPPEGLLSDILDPNRMFEARWCAYEIDTKDGKQLMGLVTGETTEAVTLTMMGGVKEIVQRSNIKEMKSLDRSLMPVGVEAGINKEQMSDLLAFLLGR